MTVSTQTPLIGTGGSPEEALAYLGTSTSVEQEYIRELWRLCQLVGFDFRILFAQAHHETDGFSSRWWLERRNSSGIGVTGDPVQDEASHTWANGVEAARAQIVHMAAYVFGNVLRWEPRTERILGPFIEPYDPRFDAVIKSGFAESVFALGDLGNGRWATDPNYASKIMNRANAIFTKETPVPKYKIVGLPGDGIELPVPLAHDIIPASQTRQRPGIPRQLPGFWVQHETDNHAPGADAEMHNRYLHNGAEGRQASWHFTVDDGIIYQHIPIDEVTWQAADGAGPGNMSGISCELCVNAGIDTVTARHNAEALCGGIMKALSMGIDRCKAHIDFNAGTADRHHCPDTMLDDGYWPGPFKANVQRVLATAPAPPDFADPAPVTWEEGDVGDQTLDGRPALAFLIEVEVNRKVVTPQVSDTDERPTGIPRKKTTKLRAIGSYRAADHNAWIVLRDGSRLKRTDVRPLVPLPDRAA